MQTPEQIADMVVTLLMGDRYWHGKFAAINRITPVIQAYAAERERCVQIVTTLHREELDEQYAKWQRDGSPDPAPYDAVHERALSLFVAIQNAIDPTWHLSPP